MKAISFTWRRVVRWSVVALLAWLLASFAVGYLLTRRPHARFAEPAPTLAWGDIQPLRLATTDGEDIGAWFIPGRGDRPVVVLLHGYSGCRASVLAQAEIAASIGCGTLLLSLRCHGDSSGVCNDFGLSARHDVIAAVGWLEANAPRRPIIVWGQSLGSAAALFAAQELGERTHGYIVECPYRDLRTAVWNRTCHYLPPLVNWAAYVGLATVAPVVLPDVDRICPLEAAATLPPTTPVLILAGGADRRARPEEARAIAERLGARARLVMIERGDHGQLLQADPVLFRTVIVEFLENVVRGQR